VRLPGDIGLWARGAAAAFVTAVVAIALLSAGREANEAEAISKQAIAIDPLEAELARCRSISDPAAVDAACRQAWADQRARFFGVKP